MLDTATVFLNLVGTAAIAIVAGKLSYFAGKGIKKHEWNLSLFREKASIRRMCPTRKTPNKN